MRARQLLTDGPDGYVAARAAAVKAAKADKDRPLAAALQALGKPTGALWAVLAAADDEALVREAVAATSELATVQAAGDRAGIVAATARRKGLVERIISAAVAEAGRGGDIAGPRRDEIRRIVERLTRAPEAVDSWVDATLRTLPDDTGGFSAFDGLTLAAPPERHQAPRRSRTSGRHPHGQHHVDTSDDVLTVSAENAPPARPDPAAVRRADRRVLDAEREMAKATERLAHAEAALAAATDAAERSRATVTSAEADLAARRSERRALDG